MIKFYNPRTGQIGIDSEQGVNHFLEEDALNFEDEYYDEYGLFHDEDESESTMNRLEAVRVLEELDNFNEDEENEYEMRRGKSYDLRPGFLQGQSKRIIQVAGRPKTVKALGSSTPWRHPGQLTKVQIIAGKKTTDPSGKKLQNAAKVAANAAKKQDLLK